MYENHIKFEVSLHFWLIWPTVRRPGLDKIVKSIRQKIPLPWVGGELFSIVWFGDIWKFRCDTFEEAQLTHYMKIPSVICLVHVVVKFLVTDYIQKRRGQAPLLF